MEEQELPQMTMLSASAGRDVESSLSVTTILIVNDESTFRELMKTTAAEIFAESWGAELDVVRAKESHVQTRPSRGLLKPAVITNTTMFTVFYIVCQAPHRYEMGLPTITIDKQFDPINTPHRVKKTVIRPGRNIIREFSLVGALVGCLELFQIVDVEGCSLFCAVDSNTNSNINIDYEYVADLLSLCNPMFFCFTHPAQIDHHFDLLRLQSEAKNNASERPGSRVLIEEVA